MILVIRNSYLCRSDGHIWSGAQPMNGWATNAPSPKTWYRIPFWSNQPKDRKCSEQICFFNFSIICFFFFSFFLAFCVAVCVAHNIHSFHGDRRRISFHHFRRIISAYTHAHHSFDDDDGYTIQSTTTRRPYARTNTNAPRLALEKTCRRWRSRRRAGGRERDRERLK